MGLRYLETKIWALGMLAAIGVSLLVAILRGQSYEIRVYTLTHVCSQHFIQLSPIRNLLLGTTIYLILWLFMLTGYILSYRTLLLGSRVHA